MIYDGNSLTKTPSIKRKCPLIGLHTLDSHLYYGYFYLINETPKNGKSIFNEKHTGQGS